ncbi:hypothetical protein B0J14DRAFT_661727 [Halenospora varia]|nr:hypothetical protein B0J14DRAFT_661727 [Halenospora varia]
MAIEASEIRFLFNRGSRIAVYEANFQGHQPGCKSASLHRLWAAYVDKQTEAATEASKLKRFEAEAATRKESAKQKLQVQREREVKRRHAEDQKKVEESARKAREEGTKALREQEAEQRVIETSLTQRQDAARRVWVDLGAKAERAIKPMDSLAKSPHFNRGLKDEMGPTLYELRVGDNVMAALPNQAYRDGVFRRQRTLKTSVVLSVLNLTNLIGFSPEPGS